MFEKDVIITDICRGGGRGREEIIYARLKDADTDETLVLHTLKYVVTDVRANLYNIVNAQEVLEKLLKLKVF